MDIPEIYMIAREFNMAPLPWQRNVYDVNVETINNEPVLFVYLKNYDPSLPCYEVYQGMRVEYIFEVEDISF